MAKIIINKQDFLSGRVINLIKETQKNIQAYRQSIGEKNNDKNIKPIRELGTNC